MPKLLKTLSFLLLCALCLGGGFIHFAKYIRRQRIAPAAENDFYIGIVFL